MRPSKYGQRFAAMTTQKPTPKHNLASGRFIHKIKKKRNKHAKRIITYENFPTISLNADSRSLIALRN